MAGKGILGRILPRIFPTRISPRGDTLPLIRRLWRDWMRPHARTLALVLVLVALVAGATGLYPVLIKAAFDAFTAKDRQRDPARAPCSSSPSRP